MASSGGGHLLVPKAMRLIRFAVEKTGRIIREKLPQAAKTAIEAETQPAYARISRHQPANRIASIRQGHSRWYSTKQAVDETVRHFSSQTRNAKPSRANYPASRTATAVSQFTGRAPFASTLRPNLTGGTMSRSAGGYTLGGGRAGGARYFSHGPAAPAQVVQNVSQAVRAFWLSGQKVRYDGATRAGEKRFRAISSTQEDARYMIETSSISAAGSYIDFKVTPTITAIGPLANIPRGPDESSCPDYEAEQDTLNNNTLMSSLSVDFARALKDLAAIMNDLKHLSTLGDLPIILQNATTLRVRFPGCDADTVEALCRELNIKRGMVGQDEDFDARNGTEIALLFPYAPSNTASEACLEDNRRPTKRVKRDQLEWTSMLAPIQVELPQSAGYSHMSATSHSSDEFDIVDGAIGPNPWLSSPSGYSSLHGSDERDDVAMYFQTGINPAKDQAGRAGAGYEGLEGIYRFIEQCDRARS